MVAKTKQAEMSMLEGVESQADLGQSAQHAIMARRARSCWQHVHPETANSSLAASRQALVVHTQFSKSHLEAAR